MLPSGKSAVIWITCNCICISVCASFLYTLKLLSVPVASFQERHSLALQAWLSRSPHRHTLGYPNHVNAEPLGAFGMPTHLASPVCHVLPWQEFHHLPSLHRLSRAYHIAGQGQGRCCLWWICIDKLDSEVQLSRWVIFVLLLYFHDIVIQK